MEKWIFDVYRADFVHNWYMGAVRINPETKMVRMFFTGKTSFGVPIQKYINRLSERGVIP